MSQGGVSFHAAISHRSLIKCEDNCGKCQVQPGPGQGNRVYEGNDIRGRWTLGSLKRAPTCTRRRRGANGSTLPSQLICTMNGPSSWAAKQVKPCEEDFLHAQKERSKRKYTCVPADMFHEWAFQLLERSKKASLMEVAHS